VIEIAPEQFGLKRDIFGSSDQIAPPHALLATNTSSLPISEIAKSLRDPTRFVCMYFDTPCT